MGNLFIPIWFKETVLHWNNLITTYKKYFKVVNQVAFMQPVKLRLNVRISHIRQYSFGTFPILCNDLTCSGLDRRYRHCWTLAEHWKRSVLCHILQVKSQNVTHRNSSPVSVSTQLHYSWSNGTSWVVFIRVYDGFNPVSSSISLRMASWLDG